MPMCVHLKLNSVSVLQLVPPGTVNIYIERERERERFVKISFYV